MEQNTLTETLDQIRKEVMAEGCYYVFKKEGKVTPNYSHINNGYCGVFTGKAMEILGDRVLLCCSGGIGTEDDMPFIKFSDDLPEHYFLKCGTKFYDSECIEGVDNHLDLPIFKCTNLFKRLINKLFRK